MPWGRKGDNNPTHSNIVQLLVTHWYIRLKSKINTQIIPSAYCQLIIQCSKNLNNFFLSINYRRYCWIGTIHQIILSWKLFWSSKFISYYDLFKKSLPKIKILLFLCSLIQKLAQISLTSSLSTIQCQIISNYNVIYKTIYLRNKVSKIHSSLLIISLSKLT